ncbi:unnamed protein product [Ixodes persulcatus]
MAAKTPFVTLSSGRQVPVVGLGTWKSEPGKVYEAVKNAIDAGYRHIDCALAYQNEDEVGRAIEEKIKEGVVERKDLWVTSKVWKCFDFTVFILKSGLYECVPLLKRLIRPCHLSYLVKVILVLNSYDGTGFFFFNESFRCAPKEICSSFPWSYSFEKFLPSKCRDQVHTNYQSLLYMAQKHHRSTQPTAFDGGIYKCCNSKSSDLPVTYLSMLFFQRRNTCRRDTGLNIPLILNEDSQVLIRYQLERGVIAIPKSVTNERIVSNLDVFDFKLNPEEMKAIDKFNRNHRFLLLPWAKEHKHYPFNIEF